MVTLGYGRQGSDHICPGRATSLRGWGDLGRLLQKGRGAYGRPQEENRRPSLACCTWRRLLAGKCFLAMLREPWCYAWI